MFLYFQIYDKYSFLFSKKQTADFDKNKLTRYKKQFTSHFKKMMKRTDKNLIDKENNLNSLKYLPGFINRFYIHENHRTFIVLLTKFAKARIACHVLQ